MYTIYTSHSILKKVYSKTSKIKCLFCPEDENLLCFLFQSIHLILDIWHLRLLKIVPKGSPSPKTFWHQKRVFSMFRSWITPQVRLSLLEVILGPLQPFHPILDCQVDLRLLKMAPNDSPSPKTWGLTPEPWPWHIQELSYSPSYSFTSWSPPWPPTAPPPHS